MRQIPYASAVGSLMYAMLCTRLDICYLVGMVSRYQSNPWSKHWEAVKHILKYLRITGDYMLVYHFEDLIPIGYIDFVFQSDLNFSKSTSGCIFTMGGGAISWRSVKQFALLTPPWKLNMLLLVKQKMRLFGSRNSFMILVLWEWRKFQLQCFLKWSSCTIQGSKESQERKAYRKKVSYYSRYCRLRRCVSSKD